MAPTTTPKRTATVALYQDTAGEWRWRFIANGNIMADSAEGYTRRRAALRAWTRFSAYVKTLKFAVIDLPNAKIQS
jgi:hypothetical protein